MVSGQEQIEYIPTSTRNLFIKLHVQTVYISAVHIRINCEYLSKVVWHRLKWIPLNFLRKHCRSEKNMADEKPNQNHENDRTSYNDYSSTDVQSPYAKLPFHQMFYFQRRNIVLRRKGCLSENVLPEVLYLNSSNIWLYFSTFLTTISRVHTSTKTSLKLFCGRLIRAKIRLSISLSLSG